MQTCIGFFPKKTLDTLVLVFGSCPLTLCPCLVPKEKLRHLRDLGESFSADTFNWDCVKSFGLKNRCLSDSHVSKITCGKLLLHCKNCVTSFREKMGIRLTVFKVGVTCNPIQRYPSYMAMGFHEMHVIAASHSIDLIHMIEAALVMEFHKHVGCRNKEGTGGEGALNKPNRPPGPYFVYVTGGRADQPRNVG